MEFWLVATLLTLAVGVTLLRAMMRARAASHIGVHQDISVYRNQLAAIDADFARGSVQADEAERLRTEVSRRLLAADAAHKRHGGAHSSSFVQILIAGGVITAILVGSFGLYRQLGVPGYPDLPLDARLAAAEERYSTRISQEEAEKNTSLPQAPQNVQPDFLQLMEKLRLKMQENPDDPRGWALLARNEAALGNLRAAIDAQTQLIRVKGAEARADDYAALAELMIFAAGGYVSPDAERALMGALNRDAQNGSARYYLGEMFAQVGRFDRSFGLWRPLLESSSFDDPWVAPIRAQIGEVAARAGIEYTLPPTKGPTADDIAAAQDMSEADRKAMIEGMVAQLGARLADEGGSAAEWARLISSLGVLGRKDEAQNIYNEAKTRFSDAPDDLRVIDAAANDAGLALQ